MTKRRIIWVLVVVAVLYFGAKEAKGPVVDWYVQHYYGRETAVHAGPVPDQVWLTIAADPQTSVAVQWRTSPDVAEGWVQYRPADTEEAEELRADTTIVSDRLLKNDPENHRHAAVITGLQPGTTYAYRVGSKSPEHWSDWFEFTTAPATPEPFSFVYLGDPQRGFEFWGDLLEWAQAHAPDAAFYAIAGDLVNDGDMRNEWDAFFRAGEAVFGRVPAVPALGNHDYTDRNGAKMYLDLLTLPENGPEDIPPECAYSFEYGDVLFLVLDSNLDPEEQAPWLERRLRYTDATWKVVLYHHPAYSSRSVRNNEDVREIWGSLFDKYHVDLALQGHDHAYLRTWPMRAGKRAASPKEGTVYVVSNSGTKFYEQDPSDYTAVGFENESTYQVVRVRSNPNRLIYRSYNIDGVLRDELVIKQ